MPGTAKGQLDALSIHLRQHRNELLERWRDSVRGDPELPTNSSLSRRELDDHIPRLLEDFERRLRAEHALDEAQTDLQQRKHAAEHGGHRWLQGYDIRETLREWGHLQRIMTEELERYAAEHPELDCEVMIAARKALVELCMAGNGESAARYVRHQQTEAASRLRDLEASLNALQGLENERAMLLRETAHDLRGSVGVLATTTALLAKSHVTGPQREHFYDLLQQRIRSMGALLTDLTELARLEAGQDPLRIEPFDAAERVRACCDELRPVAAERNLFLKCEGPSPLPVEGDALKLQRIVQNLLLNSLKATDRGGVVVRWSIPAPDGARQHQWCLSIEDTGRGFDPASAATLRPQADARSAALPSGEGIGLSIVKRLCRIMGATVDVESAPDRGTMIRLVLPLRYPHRADSSR